MYSLCLAEGSFFFVDFTLACCQLIVLNNYIHIIRCPSPVLGHHPFLVVLQRFYKKNIVNRQDLSSLVDNTSDSD